MLDEAGVTAAEIMTKDVAVVHPETPLLAAVKLMASRTAVLNANESRLRPLR